MPTIWAWRLNDGDAAAAELLGQVAGGGLLRRQQVAAGELRPVGLPGAPRSAVAIPV